MGKIALIIDEPAPGESYGVTCWRVVQYLRAGVPVVWLVDRIDNVLVIYRAGQAPVLAGGRGAPAVEDPLFLGEIAHRRGGTMGRPPAATPGTSGKGE